MLNHGGLNRSLIKKNGVIGINFPKEKNLEQIKKLFGNLLQFWNDYNGFTLLSVFLGIFTFFLIFFKGGPTYHVFIIGFFFLNLTTSLIGVLYILGFCFLLLHFIGIISKIHENSEQSTKKRPNFYIYLSLFTFLSFDILTYIYFLILPHPSHITYCGYPMGCQYFPPPFEIASGFISSLVLICIMIISIIYSVIYDKMVLRQLYNIYLPLYSPKKYQKKEELEEI